MKKGILYFILATFLLGIVLLDIALWVYITLDDSKTLNQMKLEYNAIIPTFIQYANGVAIFNTCLLSIAGALFYKCITLRYFEKLSKVLLIITLFLACWMLFSMM